MKTRIVLRRLAIFISIAFGLVLTGCGASRSPGLTAAPKSNYKGPQWVKVCDRNNVCRTHHERLNAKVGLIVVSVEIIQKANEKGARLKVTVPHGVIVPAKLRLFVDKSKDPFVLPIVVCNDFGCVAETRFTSRIRNKLFNGQELLVGVFRYGKPIAFKVPLYGLRSAYRGAPIDRERYMRARSKLIARIAKRRRAFVNQIKEQRAFNERLLGGSFPGLEQ